MLIIAKYGICQIFYFSPATFNLPPLAVRKILKKYDFQFCEDLLGVCKSEDCKNITHHVKSQFGNDIPVLPLKYSNVFNTIFEKEKSITLLMQANGLNKYLYREVSEQFNEIYKLIDTKYGK